MSEAQLRAFRAFFVRLIVVVVMRKFTRIMRNAVLSILPQASRELLDKIEQFAGIEVMFAGSEALPRPVECDVASEAACILHDSATIYILGDAPSPAGVTHELHHIHRHWCEKIPEIIPNYDHPDNWAITATIEGALEHIVIIPRDAAIGFPAPEHWNDSERPNWVDYPWPNIKGQLTRRMKVFAGWLARMEHVSDQEINDQATACITQEGLLDEAKKFHRDIMKCIHHKPSTVALFLKALGLPRDQFTLVTHDVCNRQRICEAIPEC